MTDNQTQLRRELRAAGASDEELSQLPVIAARLSKLKHSDGLSPRVTRRRRVGWRIVLRPVAYTSLGVVLGMLLLVASQAAPATSWLFPVQKASDSVAMNMYPQYRATVMMKRARQVNQLVSAHASNQKVLATLADYTRAADAYKSMPHANYAAFEYCESNLRQASADASPNVQRAITDSLQSLETS